MDFSLRLTASQTAARLRATLVSMLMSGLFPAEAFSWLFFMVISVQRPAEKQDSEKTRSYQDQRPEGNRQRVEGLGRPATTDPTAVIRPPQNKPGRGLSLTGRGRTLCCRVRAPPRLSRFSSKLVHAKPGLLCAAAATALLLLAV